MKNKKILLTGGHLSPLLAVYEELQGKVDIVIIGRRYSFERDKTESLEYQLFKKQNVPFYDIQAPRFQRKFTKDTIPSFFKSPKALQSAFSILKKERPNAVLIFGGYIGLPVAIAAKMLRIPIVIHEQTLMVGLANKYISKFAQKICVSFPESERYFDKKKTVLTGNPVRKEIFNVSGGFSINRKKPLLYITGGSTGSHAINLIVSEILPNLLEVFTVIHQTGDAQEFLDFFLLSEKREALPENLQKDYILRKFILPSEIGWIYNLAEVVLSRAGINTVSELLALSKKALLIPLPHGQKNEQLENAKMYKKSGLGSYLLQNEATPERTLKELLTLLQEKNKNKTGVYTLAAEKIAEVTLSVL